VTTAAGLALPTWNFTGFGAAWLDYDNDGRLDLLQVNGAVKVLEEQRGERLPLKQRKHLFRNIGGAGAGRFEEVTARAGPAFTTPEVSRGAAFGDVDGDGDTDVLVANNGGPARLLLNQVGAGGRWIGLRLVTARAGGRAGRDALGARVGIERAGAPTLWRRARADGSYASASDPRVLVGLGESGDVSRIIVRWPSGRSETFPAPPLGAYLTLREGEGKPLQ